MQIPLRQSWRLLSTYLRPQWPRVLLLGLLLFGSIALDLLKPQVLRIFIDTVTTRGALATLTRSALLFVGIAIAIQLVAVVRAFVSEQLRWETTNPLRVDLAAHCLRLDMPFHNTHTPGEMIERIDGDINALSNFFSQFAIDLLGSVLLLVGILVMLFREAWLVGLAFTLFSCITLATLLRLRRVMVKLWEGERQASADLFGFLEERLAALTDMRANGAQSYVMRHYYRYARALFRIAWRADLFTTFIFWLVINPLFLLASVGILALGAYLYRIGSISVGTVFLFFSFSNVSFSYQPDEPVLSNVSFNLPAGRVLGLLGRTGSGKTTIMRLLCRLYDVQSGTISVGGHDLRTLPLAELRRHVGVVTQEVQIFQASVRDNLTFFDKSIADEDVLRVLHELGLGRWYAALPEGLDTSLSYGSHGLSAGEAQLLAFARVFLRDPGLVILDEATSRLDPATEDLIERAIDHLLHNRTVIIIAHRLATVQRADQILILDKGHIREQGARSELVADPHSYFSALLKTSAKELLV